MYQLQIIHVTLKLPVGIELPKLKKAANQIVAKQYLDKANQKAADTPCQGEMVTLLGQEETDISWKAVIYAVPKGVMSWSLRACARLLRQPGQVGQDS